MGFTVDREPDGSGLDRSRTAAAPLVTFCNRSKARHEAGAKEGHIRAAAAGSIIAAPRRSIHLRLHDEFTPRIL